MGTTNNKKYISKIFKKISIFKFKYFKTIGKIQPMGEAIAPLAPPLGYATDNMYLL